MFCAPSTEIEVEGSRGDAFNPNVILATEEFLDLSFIGIVHLRIRTGNELQCTLGLFLFS